MNSCFFYFSDSFCGNPHNAAGTSLANKQTYKDKTKQDPELFLYFFNISFIIFDYVCDIIIDRMLIFFSQCRTWAGMQKYLIDDFCKFCLIFRFLFISILSFY